VGSETGHTFAKYFLQRYDNRDLREPTGVDCGADLMMEFCSRENADTKHRELYVTSFASHQRRPTSCESDAGRSAASCRPSRCNAESPQGVAERCAAKYFLCGRNATEKTMENRDGSCNSIWCSHDKAARTRSKKSPSHGIAREGVLRCSNALTNRASEKTPGKPGLFLGAGRRGEAVNCVGLLVDV
jgi:hypothetical protein